MSPKEIKLQVYQSNVIRIKYMIQALLVLIGQERNLKPWHRGAYGCIFKTLCHLYLPIYSKYSFMKGQFYQITQ